MKYVRAKNKIYEIIEDHGSYCVVKAKRGIDHFTIRYGLFNAPRADTIAELCDMFVLLNKDNGRHKVCYPQDIGLNMSIFKGLGAVNQELYGEIWVNDELRKVAKLNDKGELELL